MRRATRRPPKAAGVLEQVVMAGSSKGLRGTNIFEYAFATVPSPPSRWISSWPRRPRDWKPDSAGDEPWLVRLRCSISRGDPGHARRTSRCSASAPWASDRALPQSTAGCWPTATPPPSPAGSRTTELATAVHLHYWDGMTMEEVGEFIGTPAGTVKSRLHRARELLRTEVGDLGLLDAIASSHSRTRAG